MRDQRGFGRKLACMGWLWLVLLGDAIQQNWTRAVSSRSVTWSVVGRRTSGTFGKNGFRVGRSTFRVGRSSFGIGRISFRVDKISVKSFRAIP